MLARLSGRYGHRGLWLMLLGAVWLLFGIGVFLEPTLPPRSWVLYEYVPRTAQAALWWATGLTAIWQGARGKARDDSLGHVALYLAPAVRVVSFGFAWVIYLMAKLVGGEDWGYDRGWYAALVWLIVSCMLALAASWPNPRQPIPHPPTHAAAGDDGEA